LKTNQNRQPLYLHVDDAMNEFWSLDLDKNCGELKLLKFERLHVHRKQIMFRTPSYKTAESNNHFKTIAVRLKFLSYPSSPTKQVLRCGVECDVKQVTHY